MLNTISWQQYITAVLLLSIAWYTYIVFRYYRAEIYHLLKIKRQIRTITPTVAGATAEVMGGIKTDDTTCLIEGNELIFSADGAADDISDQTLPKGPADDLLAEAATLVAAFEDTADKNGFLSMLQLLVGKYEACFEEMDLPSISRQIKAFSERLPFTITATEWPLTL